VPRVLDTDSARDVDGRDGVGAGGRWAAAPLADGGAAETGVCGDGSAPDSRPARLLLMMVVSCALNASRSVRACGGGEVNVKLCPLLSFSRPILRRT